ncbi:MAG: hypothetical protein IPM79_11245 [Polyangiaceae bacterium]|nr:hypothetical protein [Polyangiaceae bacterium]
MNRRHARRKKRQEHPRKRRGPGKKSKNAKMAAVGVLYTLRRAADGRLEGPANKRTYATFVSYRALFEWIHAEARRRGYGTKKFKKVLFIADGAEVLWSLQQEFLPRRRRLSRLVPRRREALESRQGDLPRHSARAPAP